MHLEILMPAFFTQMPYLSNNKCTAPGQDSIVIPGCRTEAGIYQAAASQAWFVVKEGKKRHTILSSWKAGLGIHMNYKYKICLADQSSSSCPSLPLYCCTLSFQRVSMHIPSLPRTIFTQLCCDKFEDPSVVPCAFHIPDGFKEIILYGFKCNR